MPQYPVGAASSSNPPPNGILAAAGVVGVAGLTWLGAWSNVFAYVYGQAVTYGGSSYVAVAPNINVTPGTNPSIWVLIASGAGAPTDLSSYTTTATGSTNPRTLGARAADAVNVLDFVGVDPTGATLSDAGIAAAVAEASARAYAGNPAGSLIGGGTPKLFFPQGLYKISTAIALPNYIWIEGDRSTIWQSVSSQDIFTSLKFNTNIHGIIFQGGSHQLSVATSNADTTMITVEECEFIGWTTDAIYVDNNSNSTSFSIERCKFYNTNPAVNVLNASSGDKIKFRDVWVSAAGTVFSISAVALYLDGMFGVPQDGTGAWVSIGSGGDFYANGCRFGGESGGKTIVINNAPPSLTYPIDASFIIIENSACFAAGQPMITFNELPNFTIIRGNSGLPDSTGLFFSPTAISAASKNAIGNTVFMDVQDNMLIPYLNVSGSDQETVSRFQTHAVPPDSNTYLDTVDYFLGIPSNSSGYGLNSSGSNVTSTPSTGPFGAYASLYTATAEGGTFTLQYTTALAGAVLPQNFTYIYNFEVQNEPAFFQFSGLEDFRTFAPGRYVVCSRVYGSIANAPPTPTVTAILKNGGAVALSSYRIFYGIHDIRTPNTIMLGNAAPTSGGMFWVGDQVINTVPAAGAPIGWECVTAGSPGTWIPMTGSQVASISSFGTNVAGNSGTGTPKERLSTDGVIYLEGSIVSSSGTVTAGSTLFTLDAAYRPNRTVYRPVSDSSGNVSALIIQTNGVVTSSVNLVNGGATLIIGCSFTQNN